MSKSNLKASNEKRRAREIQRKAGRAFVKGFIDEIPAAIATDSGPPCVLWQHGNAIDFAWVREFSGPRTTEAESVLLRISVNMYRPVTVDREQKKWAKRLKINTQDFEGLGEDPLLELTAHPDQVAALGGWVANWVAANHDRSPKPPTPPCGLVTWEVGDDQVDRSRDVMDLGEAWRKCISLWAPKALEEWKSWLANSAPSGR